MKVMVPRPAYMKYMQFQLYDCPSSLSTVLSEAVRKMDHTFEGGWVYLCTGSDDMVNRSAYAIQKNRDSLQC